MTAAATSTLTQAQARTWLERWDRQQEYYIPDREQRFDVVVDVVADVVHRDDPLVIDLGIGPGSLAHRLLDRIPGASIVGVDADPLLMRLGATARPDDRIRTVLADLRSAGWYDELGLERAPDAYVSSTALHWMDRGPLRDLIHVCRRNLTPGGVFVDADHLYESPERTSRLDLLGQALTQQRIERAGVLENEDWQGWWDAVEEAPELVGLVTERDGGLDHTITDRATAGDYLDFLGEAGFTDVGVVWQYGDDRVVVGLA
ncbi:methyltransferase family protein [Nocardioides albertanoniae]|uniref:Methyltransferase family protein n=1 Tax=Nocardioides albertanoniae TaxID=1175486 RepID=A0A543A9A5_9ACTN|nr:class I SAM-dependent methyltransferase [Nocardioides albertanoniae]TQL69090.1 methyltransferase family protein [Nocardioides albertanoniae]